MALDASVETLGAASDYAREGEQSWNHEDASLIRSIGTRSWWTTAISRQWESYFVMVNM
jgi:hypothetical protein